MLCFQGHGFIASSSARSSRNRSYGRAFTGNIDCSGARRRDRFRIWCVGVAPLRRDSGARIELPYLLSGYLRSVSPLQKRSNGPSEVSSTGQKHLTRNTALPNSSMPNAQPLGLCQSTMKSTSRLPQRQARRLAQSGRSGRAAP
jgi:hypothetical protein